MPLFTPEQLVDHERRIARWWHLSRKVLAVGWRTLQASGTVEGVIVDGETDPDGDTCFNLVAAVDVNWHCEVDPADLAALRADLLRLEAHQRVRVTGAIVADLGHGNLEVHPVRKIEVL